MKITTQPIPLITSDDGLKATSIENLIQTSLNPELPEVEWLPLTIQQEANAEIMGYEVEQCNNPFDHNDIWETVSENVEPSILEKIREKCNMRRVYILTPNPTLEGKEEEKQKNSTPYNLEEAAWNYNVDLNRINKYDEYAEVDFIAGAQWQAKNSGLISKEKQSELSVEEAAKEYTDSIGGAEFDAFIAGHNHAIDNKGLISREKVIHELQTSLEDSGLAYDHYIEIINKFKNP